jgi:hypothetical protein
MMAQAFLEELFRTFSIAIFVAFGAILMAERGQLASTGLLLTPALLYLPFGLALRAWIEGRLKNGQAPPRWALLWITVVLDETVRAMALFGVATFGVAPVLLLVFGPGGAVTAWLVTWVGAISWIPVASLTRVASGKVERPKATLQQWRRSAQGMLMILITVTTTLVVFGAASWTAGLVVVLLSTAIGSIGYVLGRPKE